MTIDGVTVPFWQMLYLQLTLISVTTFFKTVTDLTKKSIEYCYLIQIVTSWGNEQQGNQNIIIAKSGKNNIVFRCPCASSRSRLYFSSLCCSCVAHSNKLRRSSPFPRYVSHLCPDPSLEGQLMMLCSGKFSHQIWPLHISGLVGGPVFSRPNVCLCRSHCLLLLI